MRIKSLCLIGVLISLIFGIGPILTRPSATLISILKDNIIEPFRVNNTSQYLLAEESKEYPGKELPDLGVPPPTRPETERVRKKRVRKTDPDESQEAKDARALVNEAIKKLGSAKGMHLTIVTKEEQKKGNKTSPPREHFITKGIYKKNPSLGVEYGKVLTHRTFGEAMKGVIGLKVTPLGQDDKKNDRFEYYKKIDGSFFIAKSGKSKRWERIPKIHFGPSIEDRLKMLRDRMKKPKITGEERLNDKDCQIVVFSLSIHGLNLKKVFPQFRYMFRRGKLINPLWKVWIGKEDGYLYKSLITLHVVEQTPADHILKKILAYKKHSKIWLGITGETVAKGVKITSVMPNTAAERAGLKKNDTITAFDRVKTRHMGSLQKLISKHKPGDEVKINIFRNKEEIEITAKLGQWPPIGPKEKQGCIEEGKEKGHEEIEIGGIAVAEGEIVIGLSQREFTTREITQEIVFANYNKDTEFEIPEKVRELLGLTPYLGVRAMPKPGVNGLVIIKVIPGSPADRSGLKKGDIITEFDGQPVTDEAEIRKLLKQHKVGDEVKIKILTRDDQEELELTVKLGEAPEYK